MCTIVCIVLFLLMSKCFNVPNYFAYLKISCYTSLKFLSLGVNTSGFICSFIQNKKASPNSWWAAWDSRNGEWEQLQIWLGEAMPLGSSVLWHNVPLVCWYCFPGRLSALRRPLIHGWILKAFLFSQGPCSVNGSSRLRHCSLHCLWFYFHSSQNDQSSLSYK